MNTIFQLAALFSAVNEIEGRKKLQKTVHILQEFGVSFGVSFGYHHYGPFSEQLQDCLQVAQHDQLIKETETSVAGQPTFRFQAEERLLQLHQLLGNGELPAWSNLAVELNQKTPRDLETISTLIYLKKLRGDGVDDHIIETEFKSLKPHLVDRLEQAKRTLDELKGKYPLKNIQAQQFA